MMDEDDGDEDDDAAATCDDELSIAIPTGLDVIFSRIKDEELMLLMLSTIALLPLRSIGRPKMQYVPWSLSTSPFMHGMYSTVEL
jgi:hypothetical protein